MSIAASFRSASFLHLRWVSTSASLSSILKWPGIPQGSNSHLLSSYQSSQVRFRSNRSRRGLYDGKDVRTGNNVPFSLKKTKRRFLPNVFIKRVYSEILDTMIPFHLTTSALRTIDKAGGLDNYLLTSKHVTEGEGFKVKLQILQKMQTCRKKGVELLGKVIIKSKSDVNTTKTVV